MPQCVRKRAEFVAVSSKGGWHHLHVTYGHVSTFSNEFNLVLVVTLSNVLLFFWSRSVPKILWGHSRSYKSFFDSDLRNVEIVRHKANW